MGFVTVSEGLFVSIFRAEELGGYWAYSYTEYIDKRFLGNIATLLPNYTVSYRLYRMYVILIQGMYDGRDV
jgi:hypothetical protein